VFREQRDDAPNPAGFPPNPSMFSFTQRSPSRMSKGPWLPEVAYSSPPRSPKIVVAHQAEAVIRRHHDYIKCARRAFCESLPEAIPGESRMCSQGLNGLFGRP
jgi:hypothetical protein